MVVEPVANGWERIPGQRLAVLETWTWSAAIWVVVTFFATEGRAFEQKKEAVEVVSLLDEVPKTF